MLIPQENQKNKKITGFLLSVFLFCFFSFLNGQVYIPQGVTVYVEKNTVITENLANAISASGNAAPESSDKTSVTQKENRDDKNSVTKRAKTKPKAKNTFDLSQKNKQQAPKKQKPKKVSLGYLFKNKSDENFTPAGSSEKPVVFPDHHLKWEVPETLRPYSITYFVEKNKSFYTCIHPLIRTSRSFRTRPPPSFSLL